MTLGPLIVSSTDKAKGKLATKSSIVWAQTGQFSRIGVKHLSIVWLPWRLQPLDMTR